MSAFDVVRRGSGSLNRLVQVLSLFLIVCLTDSLANWASEKTEDPFPMSVGSYWIYRGIVRWTHGNSNEVSETKVEWKTQIRQLIHHGEYSAAVVNGFPSELNWSDGRTQPVDSLVIQFRSDKFYLVTPERLTEDLERLEKPQDSRQGMLNEDDLFLQFPLAKNKKFCDAEGMVRPDGRYCWVVESSTLVPLALKGVPWEPRISYRVRYITNPDGTNFDFIPGLGLASYAYHHHGTVADTELKLSEFHPVYTVHE